MTSPTEEPRTVSANGPSSASELAMLLGETEDVPVATLGRLVDAKGIDWAVALLRKTMEVENAGGMMVRDGSRRRTPGGTYLFLAKRRMGIRALAKVFPEAKEVQDFLATRTTSVPRLRWNDRDDVVQEALNERGEAKVKITLTGKPNKVICRGDVYVLAMEQKSLPSLPKALPQPPKAPTLYSVYVAARQWRRISDAARDPTATVVIDGVPFIDTKTNTIAVFATNASIKTFGQT